MSDFQAPEWAKFQVGQNVWCKDAHSSWKRHHQRGNVVPVIGGIYSIRELTVNFQGLPFARFNEIVNRVRNFVKDGRSELAFNLAFFEPVREQNIELFRRMCLEVPVRATELQS